MLHAMIFGLAATFSGSVRGADGAELLATLYPSKLHPHVSIYTHVLLFHGLGPTRLRDVPSGRDALAALTDEEVAIRTFGASPFVRTRAGVRYLLTREPMSRTGVGESHRDQCLATFAALKLPLTTPLRLKAHAYTLADLMAESLASFSFEQAEPAWTAIAYAEYLPPRKEWTNRFCEPFVLQAGVKTGLKIRYRNPAEVGADRVAAALGAALRHPGRDVIVVDCGTATTFDVVTAGGDYLGGAILPGVGLSAEVLSSRTAKLPAVEIARPEHALGRTSVESIQSGLYHGQAGAIRHLIALLTAEAFKGDPRRVIGTGGFARMFEAENLFHETVPELVLLGLRQAAELNAPPGTA